MTVTFCPLPECSTTSRNHVLLTLVGDCSKKKDSVLRLTKRLCVGYEFLRINVFLAGTNEAAIVEVLAHRTNSQRQRVKEAYKVSFGKVRFD